MDALSTLLMVIIFVLLVFVLAQGFLLGAIQISVSAAVNTAIVLAASAIATFSATRPAWLRGQRLVAGALLAAFALRLALGGG